MNALLSVRGLGIRFGATAVVQDVAFDIAPGGALGLVGESGSGKSMTALAVAGLLPPAARATGSVRFAGHELLGAPEPVLRPLRGARIGMVFQEATGALHPLMPIGAQVAEAVRGHDRSARAAALLAECGLDARLHAGRFPHELSGGQQQRALIALALAGGPDLLVADEPTTALDPTVQAEILALLDGLRRRRGMALLMISHDLAVVARMADHVAVMQAGRVVEAGPTARVLGAPRAALTRALLAARQPPPRPAPPPAGAPLLMLDDVAVRYGTVRAADGVTLHLAAGVALGLVGESGSGKSTLARLAVGLLRPERGRVRIGGLDPATAPRRAVARAVQLVFQDSTGSLNPRLTVGRLMAEPFRLHALAARAEWPARVLALLAEVGLGEEHLARYPHQLSGGQRQRVAIARALAVNPFVLVCDEPVSALDATVQARVLALLDRIRRARGLALLFISHDLAAVAALCDAVAVMQAGRIVEQGSIAQVLAAPRARCTAALLAAVPRLAERVEA
jgi:peptide/nickel transport system ATP-binding protein